MPKKIAVTTLNASTIDILNTIRANASANYVSTVPTVSVEQDIPKVGEILVGYPALANEFISALMNRIAEVRIRSAEFNNAYAMLKKGYLEFGETVENVFVQITKAREFSTEKAAAREFAKTPPKVKAEFYAMNYRVQYPVTITDEELRTAFMSASGVEDMIARIVSAITTAAEYDEFLLFKYLIIKAVNKGQMYPVGISTDIKDAAVNFRAASNGLTFMNTKYNVEGVHTTTPKADQCIFMDATFNAKYDVNVLASAFNMDKADFMGRLFLIDDFTTFDNDRFSEIRAGSDQIETVTSTELAMMANVKAILLDREWFQVYDNLSRFTEKYVASGLYWNYFYNVWKTVASSGFSNAIVFVDATDAATAMAEPSTLTATVHSIDRDASNTVYTLTVASANVLAAGDFEFIRNSANATAGITVHPYGAYIVPVIAGAGAITAAVFEGVTGKGTHYKSSSTTLSSLAPGGTITLTKQT